MIMKLRAPEYYKQFKCIADRCAHSCCVGWEIDIDGDTAEKYASLTDGYGSEIAKSIEWNGTPHFRLCENDRCPHLDGRGLCRIITHLGEGYLCHICREHPRFYNDTPNGTEVGIGMSCEEAARLILSSDGYMNIEEIGEDEGEENEFFFDPLPHREWIYSVLSDRSVPYPERLDLLGKVYGISLSDASDKHWVGLLESLEYLDESHRKLFPVFSSACTAPKELEPQLERALAYFIYRHCSPAWNEEDFRASLGFSLLCERLICSITLSGIPITDAARIVSEELEYSEDNTEDIKNEFYM